MIDVPRESVNSDSTRGADPRQAGSTTAALAAFTFLAAAFWKLRIMDTAVVAETNILGSLDIYTSFVPRTHAIFERLAAGDLPLWNPYQLFGLPLLAIPASGVFYPLNLIYLLFDTTVAVEVSWFLHVLLANVGMYALMRHFGLSRLASAVAGLTFVWSAYYAQQRAQPIILATLSWMPLTALLVERSMLGKRLAWLVLALAIASQLLIGATEQFLHCAYVYSIFGLARYTAMVRSGDAWDATGRAAATIAAAIAGLCLSLPQLLPSLELVSRSIRAGGALAFAEAANIPMPLGSSLRDTLSGVYVGVLPVIGLALAATGRRRAIAWICGLTIAVLGVSLAAGGLAFRLHFELPWGDLFRRPFKFMDLYCFGQAMVAGLVVAGLESSTTGRRGPSWLRADWLAGVGICVAGYIWLAPSEWGSSGLLWLGVLLAAYVVLWRTGARRGLLLAICALHLAGLFMVTSNKNIRPSAQPSLYHRADPVFDWLRDHAGYERVYLSNTYFYEPMLMPKQGIMNKIPVATDYELLASKRTRRFLEFVTRKTGWRAGKFSGTYKLGENTRWNVMRLTGTRYYVVPEEGGTLRRFARRSRTAGSRDFKLRKRIPFRGEPEMAAQIYEFKRAMPRAYFVPTGEVVDDDERTLSTLDDPTFDPWRTVLLDSDSPEPVSSRTPATRSNVRIISHTPEDVVIEVDAKSAGYLVLTDLHYPGWKGYVGGVETPILRANYLFRALVVPAGRSVVRFHYAPASFRNGLLLAGATGALIVAVAVFSRRSPVGPISVPSSALNSAPSSR